MITASKIIIILSVSFLTAIFSFVVIKYAEKILSRITAKNNPGNKKTKLFPGFNYSLNKPGAKLLMPFLSFLIIGLISGKIILAVLAAVAALAGIDSYFKSRNRKEKENFENQLLEALGMITNSVNAGQSLLQAIENMVKDTKPPMSSEFEEVLRQVRLGKPLSEALADAAKKINSKDLTIAVTSINLVKETGGNLGEILSRLAATIRERKKIKGKIVSLTAQGKASGIVMSSVPFLLLCVLYFLEPNMMGLLFNTLPGNLMLLLAVVMVSMGAFFINKIVNIDI